MRLLTGPVSPDERYIFDLLAASSAVDTRFFDDDGRPFADVLAALPADWTPDAVVVWNPEYRMLPPGLAECPYPLVILCTDWNLRLAGTVGCLPMADQLYVDRAGISALKAWGLTNVAYWPLYGVDPAKVRQRPDAPIRYDISFIGNLNHDIHQERGRWLQRLARLGSRYRVAVLTGVHGEAYGEVLSQSRIVFNHTVRGEMNVRVYEAAAAGRLVMVEADNLEVRDYLDDGVSCVLYDDEHFEAQIEALLVDPAACDRLGQAAHHRLAAETYTRHWERLQTLLAARKWEPPETRAWHRLDRVTQLCALARQALYSLTPGAMTWARRYLDEAAVLQPRHRQVRHGLACLAGARAIRQPNDSSLVTEAREQFAALLGDEPGYALAWMNAATVFAAVRDREGARTAWQAAAAAASAGEPVELADFLLTSRAGRWWVEWGRCAGLNDPAAARHLLLATAGKGIGEALLGQSPALACTELARATAVDAGDGEAWALLGAAHARTGNQTAAIAAWETSLSLLPWEFGVRQSLIKALLQLGSTAAAASHLDAATLLIRSCPVHEPLQATFDAMRSHLGPVVPPIAVPSVVAVSSEVVVPPVVVGSSAVFDPPVVADGTAKRLLIASCVRQKASILPHFLRSLAGLELPAGWQRDRLLLANGNDPTAQNLLRLWATQQGAMLWERDNPEDYVCTERRHVWSPSQIGRVAAFKDEILRFARDSGYDAVCLIDSDLVVHPATLLWLESSGQPIVSEIFWTAFDVGQPPMPNVWQRDFYDLASHAEWPDPEDYRQAGLAFLQQLRVPGLHAVGGLGACTWIGRAPLLAGVRYEALSNVSFPGEDRHFCIRAMAHDFPLYVDTHVPAYHLYRESDAAGVEAARRSWDLAMRPVRLTP